MPHSLQEKKRAMTRIRRIKGQAEALERALEQDAACASILQQIAAMRGAVNGLMAEILESHLREEFGLSQRDSVDDAMALIRSYLK